MENVTDALFMAASVLLLIIALTVGISSLSEVKAQTQAILLERNQLQMAKDETGGYFNYLKSVRKENNDNDIRTVGVEAIISSIKRMQKEGYTIYIATDVSISDASLPDNMKKDIQIQNKNYTIFLTKDDAGYKNLSDSKIIYELYNRLKDYKFKEYLGTYKEEKEGVPEEEKLTYKVITYVEDGTI